MTHLKKLIYQGFNPTKEMENLTYEIYLRKIDPHHLFPAVKKAKMILVPDNS